MQKESQKKAQVKKASFGKVVTIPLRFDHEMPDKGDKGCSCDTKGCTDCKKEK